MSFFYCISTALSNLRANKLRSALTMLGIIIGVSAVIMMVAILQGASANVTKQFSKLGSNLILVVYAPSSEERKKITRRIDGLRMADVKAIREQCPLIKELSPEIGLGQNIPAKYNGRDLEVTGYGVTTPYAKLRNVNIGTGRFISDEDSRTWAKVCVIGEKVKTDLFGNEDLIGKQLEISGQSLTVVGVLAPKGRTFDGDADKFVYLPLETVQKRILGSEIVGAIYAEPVTFEKMNDAKDQVWQLLMNRYSNLPGWKVDSFDNILNSINSVLAIFTVLLGSIAGLALLVGGIGIMNIMLVSVTERTREIGVRKAIGAKRKDILLQFLIESATLSGVGGLAGVTLGTGAAYFVGFVTTFIPALDDKQGGTKGLPMYVPPAVMLISFLFSAAVGVFFGVYPAIRASKLDPIQALRTE